MPELLLEIGCEELPSSACREIVEQAPGLVTAALDGYGLKHDEVHVWVAPRRFAVSITGLPERQSGDAKSVAGPPAKAAFDADGKPTAAAEGFARKQGVSVADLVVREGREGREVVFAEVPGESRALAELVPDITRRLVEGIRFGKTMRWGDGTGLRFSRPVRWIVAKVDAQTIPFALHGLTAADVSRGHRFIGGPMTIADASGYRDAVRTVGVVADHDERRATITAFLDAAAAELGCTWSDPLGKLNEVVYLVEWPSLIVGRIGEDHMRLPPKVLVTAMQSHQRYFPLERSDGSLYPAFLGVSNGDPAHVDLITKGNEGVLSARLQDATFSVDKDLATGLEALDAKLDTIVFHQRLGTLAQKRDRLVAGVSHLAEAVNADSADAVAAARLAKVDQGAILVAEFSELQGYAGAHYARLAGHPDAVCRAVEEHYLPEGPDSPTPQSEAGALLACAEKVDSLVGAFAIDERPTSSKDPYGLRRAAAGLVRIALERGWDLDLGPIFDRAYSSFAEQGASLVNDSAATRGFLDAFIADRLTFHLEGEGVGAEAVAATAAWDRLLTRALWATSIEKARKDDSFWSVWEAHNRCVRIAAQGPDVGSQAKRSDDPGEMRLFDAVKSHSTNINDAVTKVDFERALSEATPIARALELFFEDVLVNAEDPGVRERRYRLVNWTADALGQIADFSAVTQGGGR